MIHKMFKYQNYFGLELIYDLVRLYILDHVGSLLNLSISNCGFLIMVCNATYLTRFMNDFWSAKSLGFGRCFPNFWAGKRGEWGPSGGWIGVEFRM